jgi:hypothetical protein
VYARVCANAQLYLLAYFALNMIKVVFIFSNTNPFIKYVLENIIYVPTECGFHAKYWI